MSSELQKTPLHSLHLQHGAKMVPFAGFDMPVQYASGVKKEHLHTRAHAGLFDVSHMGQIILQGPRAAADLEKLVPVDIIDLPKGKQRYALFTNEQGGILDDIMVTHLTEKENCFYIVVNAACKKQDIDHLKANLSPSTHINILDNHALIALQGPKAAQALSRLVTGINDMVFMDAGQFTISGVPCVISRSGYTGEDGFELSIPTRHVEAITQALLEQPEVELSGLGARDSLRLESGLCLYSHDITINTTPSEAGLSWAVSKVRRHGGARSGGFIGADIILKQIETKTLSKKRVGLSGTHRIPVRAGSEIVNHEGDYLGMVTSGTYGPTVETPIAMAYIPLKYSQLETEVLAKVRGKTVPMTITKMPFIQQRYYRG